MSIDEERDIRVLHVDDDSGFLELASTYLEREDERLNIHTTTRGKEALDRLAEEPPYDCVVADFAMSDFDGLEFLKTVRANNPELPFIFFTGKGSEAVAGEAISAGVTDYLQKESGIEQYAILANRIINAVERHRATRQFDLSRQAMERATEGLSLVLPDGTFLYTNPAFAELFGYEPYELTGEHWSILYHNGEAKRLKNDILPAVSEQGYWAGETVRLTKGGERLVTDHRLGRTADDVIICTAHDVTEERTLTSDTEIGYDLLVDAIGDRAFFTLDHEGYVTRFSERAEQLMGYSAEEALGQHTSIFFTEEDSREDLPHKLIEKAKREGSATDQGWRLRKDGKRLWADMSLSASYHNADTLRGFGQIIREVPRQSSV